MNYQMKAMMCVCLCDGNIYIYTHILYIFHYIYRIVLIRSELISKSVESQAVYTCMKQEIHIH